MFTTMIFLIDVCALWFFFFFSSRRRHTRCLSDWSSDVCSSDLSPAKVSCSSTLKLPPSSVSALELVSHSARSGRGEPKEAFHSETFSAAISVCTIGTRADWFLRIVTGSFSLYSNRSPSSRPCAAASSRASASLLRNIPPAVPPPEPGPSPPPEPPLATPAAVPEPTPLPDPICLPDPRLLGEPDTVAAG